MNERNKRTHKGFIFRIVKISDFHLTEVVKLYTQSEKGLNCSWVE